MPLSLCCHLSDLASNSSCAASVTPPERARAFSRIALYSSSASTTGREIRFDRLIERHNRDVQRRGLLAKTARQCIAYGQLLLADSKSHGLSPFAFNRPGSHRAAAIDVFVSAGSAPRNHTACSPVPPAISSTSPDSGRSSRGTPQDQLMIVHRGARGLAGVSFEWRRLL